MAIISASVIEDHSMHNQENEVETKQEVKSTENYFWKLLYFKRCW